MEQRITEDRHEYFRINDMVVIENRLVKEDNDNNEKLIARMGQLIDYSLA